MEIWQAVVLGVVEGITEFLPISSTGHLVIFMKMMGLEPDSDSMIAFNAVSQTGATAALVVYFARDIGRLLSGFTRGVLSAEHRGDFDYRFGWYIVAGSIPIIIVGLTVEDAIDKVFNLWAVAIGMIGWALVMWFSEYAATQQRTERQITLKDTVFVGVVQCVSLFPGVSRSGASMSAGLLRDLDRTSATRLAFFLGIPALTGAGVLQMGDAFNGEIGTGSLLVGVVVSAVTAYASVAWLLKFVSKHTFMPFVWYRIAFGLLLLALLGGDFISP